MGTVSTKFPLNFHCPLLHPALYPLLRARPTIPRHELLQEVVPGAGMRVHFGHIIKVVIGDSHILCVTCHVNHLSGERRGCTGTACTRSIPCASLPTALSGKPSQHGRAGNRLRGRLLESVMWCPWPGWSPHCVLCHMQSPSGHLSQALMQPAESLPGPHPQVAGQHCLSSGPAQWPHLDLLIQQSLGEQGQWQVRLEEPWGRGFFESLHTWTTGRGMSSAHSPPASPSPSAPSHT